MIRIWKKFNSLFNKLQKRKMIFVICMMFITGIMEMIGVGLIVPIITIIMNTNDVNDNAIIRLVSNLFNFSEVQQVIYLLIIILICTYIFKGTLLFFQAYLQYSFIYHNRLTMQKEILNKYIHRPYEFFLQASSGEIVGRIMEEVSKTFDLLIIFMNLLTEILVVGILLITVIIINPIIALIITVVLGVLLLVICFCVKPTMSKAGFKYQLNISHMNKWILQSVIGIKEIKTSKKETYFVNQFTKYGKLTAESLKTHKIIENIPRLAVETISIILMLIILLFIFMKENSVSTVLPQLMAFAMAAVRIIPGANRISIYFGQIPYYEPMLDKAIEIINETKSWNLLCEKKEEQQQPMSFTQCCELSNISFTYPQSDNMVLEHANMVIKYGQSIGVTGCSGSGKSTAIDILLGLLQPNEGHVLCDGIDIQSNYQGWLSLIGYIPQMIFMLDDTIRNNIAFGYNEGEIDDDQIWKVIEEARLGDFVRSLPHALDTEIGERGIRISGGQRQRIGIARALYSEPQILVFDEATSSLDNQTETEIIESINNLHGKKTMIIIAHRLETIKDCDIVYQVREGKIIQETK